MLAAPLDRLLYVVIHEDCHDQFTLPYGIEEALCNVIAYRAMAAFSREKFRSLAFEYRAVRRYAREGSRHSHLTVAYYERLAALYARHDGSETSMQNLLRQREDLFKKAERELSGSAEELRRHLAREIDVWGKVIREAGVKVE